MLNRVILIGRLTDDPRLSYTQSGHAVANFRLAVDRSFTNQQGEREADFFPVVVWRKLAETCAHNLNKGRLVAVDGRLQARSYQAQDGSTRWITEVVADNVRFLDWPGDNQQQSGGQTAPPAPAQGQQQGGGGGFDGFQEEEVPF